VKTARKAEAPASPKGLAGARLFRAVKHGVFFYPALHHAASCSCSAQNGFAFSLIPFPYFTFLSIDFLFLFAIIHLLIA